MPLIPQAFIDDLLARADIVSVVEARVPLKKAGRDFQARCPFHDEKTPSFTVSPGKQFYHCFGCGAHGTVISFLMDYDRLPFREAVEVLAAQLGMAIPEQARAGPDAASQKPLFDILAAADRHYRQQLRASPQAADYLKKRGIAGATAKAFGIGFAPPGWDFLRNKLGNERVAINAGLLIARDDGHSYDRFRNRVMFPIRDARGRTIAFGGRILDDNPPDGDKAPAKYLNSPETPLFHKGQSLYGLFEARQALSNIPQMLLVEGYMDVVALAQAGFANAVATLGTATTTEHLQLLFRSTDEVIFCFDGDTAGRRAAWRALENALPAMRGTRRVRFLFMPNGEDPDSLVRSEHGSARLQVLIDNSRPASTVLLDGLAAGLEMTSADGRSRLVEKARPFVLKLPPEAFKAELVREIARRSGLPADDLERLYRDGGAPPQPAAATTDQGRTPTVQVTPVRRALQLLMNRPALADTVSVNETIAELPVAGAALLAQAIEFFRDNPNIPLAALIERWRDRDEVDALRRLAAQTPRGDTDDLAREFRECVAAIVASHDPGARARYDALLAKQEREPLSEQEAAELQALLGRIRTRKNKK